MTADAVHIGENPLVAEAGPVRVTATPAVARVGTVRRASAAAVLPAALAAGVLIGAPFAGTTTTRLAATRPAAAPAAPAAGNAAAGAGAGATGATGANSSVGIHVSPSRHDAVMLTAAEIAAVALGAGVVVSVRRRYRRDDR